MSRPVEDKNPAQNENDVPSATSHWGRRLAWFAGLWLAGITVVGALAWALKKLLQLD